METLPQQRWSTGQLLIFRFLFIYFSLFILPFFQSLVPFSNVLFGWYGDVTNLSISALGEALLNQSVGYHQTGSGDTLYDYTRSLWFVVVAFTGSVAWSIADRKSRGYPKLLEGLMVGLRIYLGVMMMGYGFAKVFKTQFADPNLARLLTTYGESSPMGLLWTFMGYSTAYNIFTGLGEVVGGLLLFFRRTKVLGCLILIAVMSNVVILNFTYDVPVKLLSSHLLAMAIFLLIPDAARLFDFLVMNRAVRAPASVSLAGTGRLAKYVLVAKVLFLTWVLYAQISSQLYARQTYDRYYASNTESLDVFGKYEIDYFIIDGDTIEQPPTRRWKSMSIEGNSAQIKYGDGAMFPWHCVISPATHRLTLVSKDVGTIHQFRYKIDGERMLLRGIVNSDSARLVMRKESDSKFLLVDRGFHWISEEPFNR